MDYVMDYKYGDGIQLSITRSDRVKHTMVQSRAKYQITNCVHILI